MQRAGGRSETNTAWIRDKSSRPVPFSPRLDSHEGGDQMRHKMKVKTVTVSYDGEQVDGRRLDQPQIAGEFITSWINSMKGIDSDQERFGFIALDGRHRLMGVKVLSTGTATQCPVDGRKLFAAALMMQAHGLILFHNHPSGDLEASRDDLDLTRRLCMGGKLIGCEIHDHIITTGARWLSLRSARAEVFSG